MKKTKLLNQIRLRRQRRIRVKVSGSAEKPRLAIFRSNRFVSGQLIDDERGNTLVAVSSRELPKEEQKKSKAIQSALTGELIAKKALKLGMKRAIFDRRAYKYHGRVKAFCEGARRGGLEI